MSSTAQPKIGRAASPGAGEGLLQRLLRRARLDRAVALFLLLGVLAVAAHGWLKPDYNWDMVAYIATALENRTDNAEQLHAQTWSLIDAGASEAQQYH